MNCPHCHKPIDAAKILGSLGLGKKKTLTQAERKRRGERLAEARKKRWK